MRIILDYTHIGKSTTVCLIVTFAVVLNDALITGAGGACAAVSLYL